MWGVVLRGRGEGEGCGVWGGEGREGGGLC